jgi:putative ABC transport system permease protein
MFALFESFRSALESIRAHGFRSLLTSLGIIIGVTSVIAVVSIVQGLSYTINAQFAGLGGNSLTIRSYTPFKKQIQGRLAKLRDSDMQVIASVLTGYRTSHRYCLRRPVRKGPSVIARKCPFRA